MTWWLCIATPGNLPLNSCHHKILKKSWKLQLRQFYLLFQLLSNYLLDAAAKKFISPALRRYSLQSPFLGRALWMSDCRTPSWKRCPVSYRKEFHVTVLQIMWRFVKKEPCSVEGRLGSNYLRRWLTHLCVDNITQQSPVCWKHYTTLTCELTTLHNTRLSVDNVDHITDLEWQPLTCHQNKRDLEHKKVKIVLDHLIDNFSLTQELVQDHDWGLKIKRFYQWQNLRCI